MQNRLYLITLLIIQVMFASGQSKGVLFIGNSYTEVNNLPKMTADVAASMGDTLIFDSNTPGGMSLYGHTWQAATLSKIAAGSWDYVVLQEQSQAPSLPTSQVQTGMFPYAYILDSLIHKSNPCAQTVFYMTWGRKNGDAINCAGYPNWQYVCTYEGMDSLINLRYRMLADSNMAMLSPVGAVWHYIRDQFPSIELYQADESHPSLAGTYAAACSFYTAIFRKDPASITFNPGLAANHAAAIRTAAKLIVYDSLLTWHIGEYDSLLSDSCLGISGIRDVNRDLIYRIYPNPAIHSLTIELSEKTGRKNLQILNASGVLVKEVEVESKLLLDVSGLADGLYFIRTENYPYRALKFIKARNLN